MEGEGKKTVLTVEATVRFEYQQKTFKRLPAGALALNGSAAGAFA
jgi:hypothetical protein